MKIIIMAGVKMCLVMLVGYSNESNSSSGTILFNIESLGQGKVPSLKQGIGDTISDF